LDGYSIAGKSVMGLKTCSSMAYAQGRLQTKRLDPDTFLSAFGMYCIDPVIFSYLNKNIENNIRSGGLIQFTNNRDSV